MDMAQQRCDKVTNFLLKRDQERKLDLEKRREDKKQFLAEHEKLDYFNTTFSEKKLEIENAINIAPNIGQAPLADHFDKISKDILKLQKYVANSAFFLRTYDVKRCHQTLQDLANRMRELEEKLLPKKKFGFKNKTKPIKQTPNDFEKNKDEVDFCKKLINLVENFCGFENKKNETLKLERNTILKKDVTLSNLENCIVRLYGNPSTLHLGQLKSCLIMTGPVSTSIFADDCVNCTLVLACQQLRLHSSTNIHIYLHVTSRAIMEDCTKIFLAPYNLKYDGLERDFKSSSLDINTNNWTAIDDFNWLNIETKSPNWEVLKESEKVTDWTNFNLPAG